MVLINYTLHYTNSAVTYGFAVQSNISLRISESIDILGKTTSWCH